MKQNNLKKKPEVAILLTVKTIQDVKLVVIFGNVDTTLIPLSLNRTQV